MSLRVVSVFPGFGVGGAQMRFVALAGHLGARVSHSIVALNGDISCRERLAPGLDVRFPEAGPKQRGLPGTLAVATRVLRAEKPDVVMTSNWGAIEWAMAARLCGFTHVHTEDGFGPEERDRQIPRRAITRRLALRGSCVILPSRTLLRIATEIWRLPDRHVRHIPNGIDLARFSPGAPRARSSPVVIGTIAALRPEKNLARLIEALALVRDTLPARLVVAGDGPERAALEQKAAFLGLSEHVAFTGPTATPERVLPGFDLFALSSDTEQMPLSVLEAMAAGLPVASTDVGDVRDMLGAPHMAEKTARGLADAILAGLADGSAGEVNLARARQEYGQDLMFSRYEDVLFPGAASP